MDYIPPLNLQALSDAHQTNALAQQMNMFKLHQAKQAEIDNQAMRQAGQGAFNQQSGELDVRKLIQATFASGDVEGALKLREVARQSDERNALRSVLTNPAAAPTQPSPQLPTQGMAPQQLPMSTQQPIAPVPDQAAPKPLSAYQKYTQAADKLMAEGMMAPAKQLYDLAKEVSPEMKEQKILTDTTGKRVVVNYFKDGTTEVQPFGPDAEKLHIADTGGSLVALDPYTNKQVGSGIRKTMTPGEIATSNRAGEANRLKAAEVRLQGGKGAFEAEDKLRDEFNKLSGTFMTVRDAHARVLASATNPSAAGDLSLIFNYMKVLDPGSTVREGEFATAAQAGGVPDRIIAQYNKVIRGERLAPNVRTDFVDRSGKLYEKQKEGAVQIADRYNTLAKGYGLRPENVTSDLSIKAPSATVGASQQFDSLPDPRQFQGKIMNDGKGNRLKATGSQWVKVQ